MRAKLFSYGRLQPQYDPPATMGGHHPDRIYGYLFDHKKDPLVKNVGDHSANIVHGVTMDLDPKELNEIDKEEIGYRRVLVMTLGGSLAWVYEWASTKPPRGALPITKWPVE